MSLNTRQSQSNSILHQYDGEEWKSIDPAGCQHPSKADGGDMLLVFTVHFMHLFKADDACNF